MNDTLYFSPKTLAEALTLLDKYKEKAVIVNGGTDIVEKIAHREINPEVLVYIQDISELKMIREESGYVCIGGAASYKNVLESSLCAQFDGLSQAIRVIGSPPIWVVGTPAGNLGTAVPAADCNVALIALNAQLVLARFGSQRVVEVREMFVSYCRTQLEPGELIKEIRIPVMDAKTASAFNKLTKRKSQDIAQVAVAVRLTVEAEVCTDVVIAMGAVGPTAMRSFSMEKALIGQKIENGLSAIKNVVPIEASLRNPRNKAYKESVICVLVERAVKMAHAKIAGGTK